MIGVVDTSALVRLFIPDGPISNGFMEFLAGVERGVNLAIAPELILVEAANVLNKKLKAGDVTVDESEALLHDIVSVPIRLFPHKSIVLRALEMAREHQLTVYDTLYLALAEERGAVLYSADQRLSRVAKGLGMAP